LQELIACGQKLKLTPSPISPLYNNNGKVSGITQHLVAEGLINQQGQVDEQWQPVLKTLLLPHTLGMIRYENQSTLLETLICYDGTAQNKNVMLVNVPPKVRVQAPPAIDWLIDELTDNIGDTMVQRLDEQLTLPISAGLMCFALVDATRESILEYVLRRGQAESSPIPMHTAIKRATQHRPGWQWLSHQICKLPQITALTQQTSHDALRLLHEQNLIQVSEGRITLGPILQNWANQFLLIDAALLAQAMWINDEQTRQTADYQAIIGRHNAVLMWHTTETELRLQGLSPAQLIIRLNEVLESPQRVLRQRYPKTGTLPHPELAPEVSTLTGPIGQGTLAVEEGIHVGQRFKLKGNMRIGRAHDNDIQLRSPHVSRYHLLINRTDKGYVLTELGSANGTWVNGSRIHGAKALKHGDIVIVGSEQMIFREE
jgi:hypothetical protein